MIKIEQLFIILFLITFMLWVLSKDGITDILNDPSKSIVQVSGLLGAVAYFTNFIFSSRHHLIEKYLPLDKAYKFHKIVGTTAGVGILVHVSTLILSALPSPYAYTLYLLPSKTMSYTFKMYYKSSGSQNRFTSSDILNSLPHAPNLYNYFICGPQSMISSLTHDLKVSGVPNSQIFNEEFDFKSLISQFTPNNLFP